MAAGWNACASRARRHFRRARGAKACGVKAAWLEYKAFQADKDFSEPVI